MPVQKPANVDWFETVFPVSFEDFSSMQKKLNDLELQTKELQQGAILYRMYENTKSLYSKVSNLLISSQKSMMRGRKATTRCCAMKRGDHFGIKKPRWQECQRGRTHYENTLNL